MLNKLSLAISVVGLRVKPAGGLIIRPLNSPETIRMQIDLREKHSEPAKRRRTRN